MSAPLRHLAMKSFLSTLYTVRVSKHRGLVYDYLPAQGQSKWWGYWLFWNCRAGLVCLNRMVGQTTLFCQNSRWSWSLKLVLGLQEEFVMPFLESADVVNRNHVQIFG